LPAYPFMKRNNDGAAEKLTVSGLSK